MSTRSHPEPQPPRPGPAVDGARATRCKAALREIAEDHAALGAELARMMSIDAPTTEQATVVLEMERLNQKALGILVVRQRSEGKSLTELAPLFGLSTDRLRKKYNPRTVDKNLQSHRPRRRRPTSPQPTTEELPVPDNPLYLPLQRLASALTRMKAEAGVSQRELAAGMHVHPSYVSRMLSGNRQPTWQHVQVIAGLCGKDPARIRPLWDAATSTQPRHKDAALYLRTYLRALRYAAGEPTIAEILNSAGQSLTEPELRQALHGPGVPSRNAVSRVTTVLHGLPEFALPVWTRARSAGETMLSAEAFG